MKTLGRVLLGFIALIVVTVVFAYADGASLPVNHSATVTGTVAARPAKVFRIITKVADGASWRHQVKSVKVLPPENGPNGKEDHWIEDLDHGVTMNFLATRTDPLTPDGRARRIVLLSDPSYGGTWTYEVSPGPTSGQTTLRITEDGFIQPPLYRFMMRHIFGMTRNLDQYMSDIQAEAAKP